MDSGCSLTPFIDIPQKSDSSTNTVQKSQWLHCMHSDTSLYR